MNAGGIARLVQDPVFVEDGLTTRAHVMLLVLTVTSVLFIVRLVRRGQLRAKYSLLWLSLGGVLVLLAAFPTLLYRFSERVGVYYPPAAFLVVAVAFLLLLVIHFSWELSRLEDRTRTLAEQHALLEARIRELESERNQLPDRSRVPDRSQLEPDG